MKKNLLILAGILFFCFGMKLSIPADAYAESMEIAEGETVENPYAIVLPEGYYIIGTTPYITSIDNFKGDYSYYHASPKNEITLDDVEKTGALELDEQDIQENLIDLFNMYFAQNHLPIYGASILKVNSSAVFFTDGDKYTLTIIGLVISDLDSNTSRAGDLSHFSSIDHPLSLEEVKSRYRAEDNADGDITNRIQFETNYDPSKPHLGIYYFITSVADNSGNRVSCIDLIYVKDLVPPTINFKDNQSTIDVEVNSNFTPEDAKKHFIVTDNYTPSDKISCLYTDNFSSHMSTLGTYSYTCNARDLDYSFAKATLTINVVDTTKPVIALEAGGDTIIANHILDDSEILALFTVSDNYYELSKSHLEIINNTCTGEQGKEYAITLRITDGSNNTQESTFKYVLADTTSPIIFVEKTLYLALGTYYSNNEILAMLKSAGIISNDAIDVQFIYDEFDTNKEGTYEIAFREIKKDGTITEGKVNLNVFSPVIPENSLMPTKKDTSYYNWYYLLLLLPVIGITILVGIKHKKHEKV